VAQKPADQRAPWQDQQKPSAAANKPAELKMQTYKGALMDASCAGVSKESSGRKAAAQDQSQGGKVSASTKECACARTPLKRFASTVWGMRGLKKRLRTKRSGATCPFGKRA
jgi:hypothetical protein